MRDLFNELRFEQGQNRGFSRKQQRSLCRNPREQLKKENIQSCFNIEFLRWSKAPFKSFLYEYSHNSINKMGKKNTDQPENDEYSPKCNPNRPAQYAYISLEKRQGIIIMVFGQGATIAAAARKYGVNSSTTKMIVKKFREKNVIFERKEERFQQQILDKEKSTNQELFYPEIPHLPYIPCLVQQYWQPPFGYYYGGPLPF